MPLSWFLLWCEEDTSFSLVDNTAVVYEDPVFEGDKVRFFFTETKNALESSKEWVKVCIFTKLAHVF